MFEFSKLICGDPCSPPLIFLHGFLGAKEDWEAMLSYFEKHFFCLAFDLPGHGSTPYTEEILSALKKEISNFVTKPILIGYSMGGRIALQLQEFSAAIIALSAHSGLSSKKAKEQRRKNDEIWYEKLLTLPFDAFLLEWYAQPIFCTLIHRPSLLELILKRRMKQNPQNLARVMRQMSLADQPHITQFLCSTLFMHGKKDLKYHKLYRKLPKNVAIRSIKHSGHAIHLEKPQACAEEILKWLKSCK